MSGKVAGGEIVDVLGKLVLFEGKPDGTYDYETSGPIEYDNGYQVSFVRPEAFKLLSSEKWDLLTNYLCEHLE